MIRRPPRSTLFPTRRSSDLVGTFQVPVVASLGSSGAGPRPAWASRSEEHTSELQSLTNLVCRLLLEKKNRSRPLPERPAARSDSDSTRFDSYYRTYTTPSRS